MVHLSWRLALTTAVACVCGALAPTVADAQDPPWAVARLIRSPESDPTWYSGGFGSFVRAGGSNVLFAHPGTVSDIVRADAYLAVRFFQSTGYPVPFDQVGVTAVRITVAGREGRTFVEGDLERYQVFNGAALLVPLKEVPGLSGAPVGAPVDVRVETTGMVSGAEWDGPNGVWFMTFRAATAGIRGPRMRVWVPVAVVAAQPTLNGIGAAVFPAGLAVSARLYRRDDFYVSLAATSYAGVIRTVDDDVYAGFMNFGGLLDLGGWVYLGATWVGDHRAGQSHPGVFVTGAAGYRLVERLANLVGF